MSGISKDQVHTAQELWGQGIVNIGRHFIEKTDYEGEAKNHIANLYAYQMGPVLFKPTKAAEAPFRRTPEEALSYFVATNGKCSEDKGFAIQPWTKVRFENTDLLLFENTAMAMGHYYFTDTEGQETKVEYSFGYVKDDQGQLRINLHHSSLPFSG